MNCRPDGAVPMQMNDAHLLRRRPVRAEFAAVIDLYLHYFKLFDTTVDALHTHHAHLGKKYIDNERLKTEDMVRRAMSNGDPVRRGDEPRLRSEDRRRWSATYASSRWQRTRWTSPSPSTEVHEPRGQEETPPVSTAPLSTHERMIAS